MNKLFFPDDKQSKAAVTVQRSSTTVAEKNGPAHSFLSCPQVRHREAKINVSFCLLFKKKTKKNTNLSHWAFEVSRVLILPATPAKTIPLAVFVSFFGHVIVIL